MSKKMREADEEETSAAVTEMANQRRPTNHKDQGGGDGSP